MLTRDLLRWRVSGEQVLPTLLRMTPGQITLCQQLIDFYQQMIGSRRREVAEQLVLLQHQTRSLVVARGLSHILDSAATYREPGDSVALRSQAFAVSTRLLARPLADGDAHGAAVAAELGLDLATLRERLYSDLPDAAVLEACERFTPRTLIEHYNLGLCQGLLLGASELQVTITGAETAVRRRILRALRWRRLLAEIRQEPEGGLTLSISGPASVLDGASRYGLQLALFLPELATLPRWQARCAIELPRRQGRGTMELGDATGLVRAVANPGYVPPEFAQLTAGLSERLAPWTCEDPALISLRSGEVVVPDLQLRHGGDGRIQAVELFHRWHVHALERRLGQVAEGQLPGLLIGMDRALAKSPRGKELALHPAFVSHGFLFSEIPTARALGERLRTMPGSQAR